MSPSIRPRAPSPDQKPPAAPAKRRVAAKAAPAAPAKRRAAKKQSKRPAAAKAKPAAAKAKPAASAKQTRAAAKAKPAAAKAKPAASTKQTRPAAEWATGSIEARVGEALAWLERHGTSATRDGMGRYGIVAPRAFGVTMADIQTLGKSIGRQHELATALWDSGWYEARLLTAFVADPEQLSVEQMERWCLEFDNWAVCDTLCFHLFDRSKYAFDQVAAWAPRREEFVKRTAFALLASLALHDKQRDDAPFAASLSWIEQGASDDRNFVKKGVSWALRAIGGRSVALNAACVSLARRLAQEPEPAARWVGKDALKDLTKPGMRQRLAARDAKRGASKPGKRPARRATTQV